MTEQHRPDDDLADRLIEVLHNGRAHFTADEVAVLDLAADRIRLDYMTDRLQRLGNETDNDLANAVRHPRQDGWDDEAELVESLPARIRADTEQDRPDDDLAHNLGWYADRLEHRWGSDDATIRCMREAVVRICADAETIARQRAQIGRALAVDPVAPYGVRVRRMMTYLSEDGGKDAWDEYEELLREGYEADETIAEWRSNALSAQRVAQHHEARVAALTTAIETALPLLDRDAPRQVLRAALDGDAS